MTNTKRNSIFCIGGDQTDQAPCSLKEEAELEELDRQAGHEYMPMDVFVDPRTVKEHFQSSSIRSRWTRIHRTDS